MRRETRGRQRRDDSAAADGVASVRGSTSPRTSVLRPDQVAGAFQPVTDERGKRLQCLPAMASTNQRVESRPELSTVQNGRQPFLLLLDPQYGLGPVVLIVAHPRTLNRDARALLAVPVDVLAKLLVTHRPLDHP